MVNLPAIINEERETDVSTIALRDDLRTSLEAAFRHWHVRDPVEWAETIRKRPGKDGTPKRFTFDYAPYQRGMYEAIFDRRNLEIIFKIFSRGGKSEVILTALGYFIHEQPRRNIVMWPKVDDAEKWSKDDFQEQLVAPTPELLEILGDGKGKRKADQTILFKLFPGGNLMACGANSPGTLRRANGNFLYADEIDSIEEGGKEGDPLAQFKTRGTQHADVIEAYASYPSIVGRSRITAKYDGSDARRWHVPCLRCGYDRWVFNRERDFRFDRDNPAGARLECPNCHDFLDDPARYQMMRNGLWIATAPFLGKAGFHASSLLWPHPVDPLRFPGGYLQMLAQRILDDEASENPEAKKMVTVNTCDAEAYQPCVTDKVEHSALYLAREEYDPREEIPEGVLLICSGVDVHPDRLEIDITGFGENEETWGLDYIILGGDPLTPEPWEKLDRILNRTSFKHPLYGFMSITAMAIDCGHRPDEVLKFTRPRLRRKVWAVFGSTTLGKPFVTKPSRRGTPPAVTWELGVNEGKDILYQRLQLVKFADGTAPHGYQHYPKGKDGSNLGTYDEEYFRQLTIEDSTMERGRDGKFYRQFEKPKSSDRNEPLDTRVYCMALPRILRTNFARLKARLERNGKQEQKAVPEETGVKSLERKKLVRRLVVRPVRNRW